jgi:dTDP-4-amino-4,6-dideoxygalactose transaminase
MIPIAKPYLGEEEAAAAREVILYGWVTQGPKVKEFEDRFAEYVGANHACAVSSCTTALHLALLAVGVKPGDVVITVSHSFIATANAVRHCGAEPVFVDINPDTYNMDPDELARCLVENCTRRDDGYYYNDIQRLAVGESPLKRIVDLCGNIPAKMGKIAAIMPVHQMGMPCDLKNILAIAGQYGLPVVEDAACTIGSEITFDNGTTWEKIGKPHGDIACFSFHPRKIITTGDGGMLTTNNPEYDKKFRLLRQHGMSVPDIVRHGAKQVIFEEYATTGYNYRMTDIQAAIGIEQLKKLDDIIAERREIAERYGKLLVEVPYLHAPSEPPFARTNWQSYPVKLLEQSSNIQQDLMQLLLDKKISTRRGIMNAHKEHPYHNIFWSLPHSETCRDNVLLLPILGGLNPNQQKNIIALFKKILNSILK